MSVTTPSSLPPAVQESLNLTILSTPTAEYIYKMPALKEFMPRHGGDTMRFRRYQALNTFKVPLGGSAVTPPSQQLNATDIDAKIDWYGTWLELSEQVVLNNQESVLNNAALRLGQSLRQTEDELISSMLQSSATHISATEGSNGDAPTEITTEDNDNITTTLVNSRGHMFLSGIEGEDKFGTAPVRKAYICMGNSAVIPDLERMEDFKNVAAYPAQAAVMDGEWGNVHNARFFVSDIGPSRPNSSSDGNTVYEMAYVAKEAYGVIDQQGGEAKFIYHPARYSGPLEQSVTAASKFAQAVRILNDAWVIVLDVTLG